MRLAKPLSLAVILLAMFAVPLVLPSATIGEPEQPDPDPDQPDPEEPVGWVTCGESPNNFCPELGWRCGHCAAIKEMPDGSLGGDASFTPMNPGPPYTIRATALLNHDPFTGAPLEVFRREGVFKIAEFVMDLGSEAFPLRYLKVKRHDGGESGTPDMEESCVWLEGTWVPFAGPSESHCDIQVCLGE